MSSQFLRREFLSTTSETAKKKVKKTKEQLKQVGLPLNRWAWGRVKKMIADRGKRVNINQNSIPSI